MGKIIDLTGQRCGRLTVLGMAEKRGKQPRWYCVCDCGQRTVVAGPDLRDGHTQSCGCLSADINTAVFVTHGATIGKAAGGRASPEFIVWSSMLTRCRNPRSKTFKHYGGRGVRVCERWQGSFENFLADMGPRPSIDHCIDRVDPDGNYEPSNCRWHPKSERNRNKRNSAWLELDGKRMLAIDWARELRISHATLFYRLKKWGLRRALTTPGDSSRGPGRRVRLAG